jgi:PAS domain S-box-containing protein
VTRDADGASERRCRALLANVADMVTISDRDGSIIYASPATRNVSGYTPREFMERNPFDSIHPEDRPRCEEALIRLVNSPGLSLELEHRVKHKDGTWRWVEGTFTSLFDDPDVGGLLATVRDITGRKKAEAALQKSEERQALLLKLSDALRTVGDPIELQETAARVLGEHLGANRVMYAEVEGDGDSAYAVISNCYADGVHPLTRRFAIADFGLVRASTSRPDPTVVADVENDPSLTDDEKVRYAGIGIGAWIGVPLIRCGRMVAALGVHQGAPRTWSAHEVSLVEVTAERTWAAVERSRAEDALLERDEQLALALQAADAGVSSLDLATGIGVTTPQWREVLGFAPPPAPQTFETLLDLVHPDDRERVAALHAGASRPRGGLDFEFRLNHPVKGERWILSRSRHVAADGEDGRLVGIAFDITERKRLESERARLRVREAEMRAETAERERISRELHDRVAHSMGVVYQYFQLYRALAENAPGSAREKLAVAEETAKTSLDQTRNLAIELRRSVADETQDGVTSALWTLLETGAPYDVMVDLTSSGDESRVPPDVGAQVYLIMREAITNALKHSGCDELDASLEIGTDGLVGTVSDDGNGFDPVAAPLDGHRAGLGLGSMRERAKMVGGQLNLTSRPGEGTTVRIRVPLDG